MLAKNDVISGLEQRVSQLEKERDAARGERDRVNLLVRSYQQGQKFAVHINMNGTTVIN